MFLHASMQMQIHATTLLHGSMLCKRKVDHHHTHILVHIQYLHEFKHRALFQFKTIKKERKDECLPLCDDWDYDAHVTFTPLADH
jgi:hypothetical protein